MDKSRRWKLHIYSAGVQYFRGGGEGSIRAIAGD